MNKNKITEILQHDVSWFVNSPYVKELDDATIGHIENCIHDGIFSGELVIVYGKNNKETTGWWHIIDWKNIAIELYNELNHSIGWIVDLGGKDDAGMITKKKNAIANFDKEWTY